MPQEFLENFMIGYSAENRLDDFWLNELPYFMKLRDITLYTVFHKKFDQSRLQRYSKLLNGIRTRIEQEAPIVFLDPLSRLIGISPGEPRQSEHHHWGSAGPRRVLRGPANKETTLAFHVADREGFSSSFEQSCPF